MKPSIGKPSSVEEPRTGVVRRLTTRQKPKLGGPRSPLAKSGVVSRTLSLAPVADIQRPPSSSPGDARAAKPGRSSSAPASDGGWRCLEWPARERVPQLDSARVPARPEPAPQLGPEVSLVQLSARGELIRQRGEDEWLPQAAVFVRRLSLLVAQGLGFERCDEVCLRGREAALSVSSTEAGRVVAVTGPLLRLSGVLCRVGLE